MADGWISYPGGAIVEKSDGSREHLLYGAEVNFDDLADHAAAGLISQNLIDTQMGRKPQHIAAQAADQANADIDRSNVDLSAVPDNYRELDEEEALGVVRAYGRSPKKQGQVLAYEILHSNRQGVVDGGSKKGRAHAEELLAEVRGVEPEAEAEPEPTEVPEPTGEESPVDDPERFVEPEVGEAAEPEAEAEAVVEDDEGQTLEPSSAEAE